MKAILILLLIACLLIWFWRSHQRNYQSRHNKTPISLWYDGAEGKLCITKNTTSSAIIELTNQKNHKVLISNFPKSERILKIPIRGRLYKGKYKISVISKEETATWDMVVKGCCIRISNRS